MRIVVEWRAAFESSEVDVLHREAFDTGESAVEERDWRVLVEKHSLGWVTAREGGRLVGFANVIWDGWTMRGCRTLWSVRHRDTRVLASEWSLPLGTPASERDVSGSTSISMSV
jgi:hypothetical protein